MQHLTFRMPATDRDSLRAAAGELETQGAALDLCSAVVLGDAPAVHRYLDKDPSLVNALPAVTRYEWRLIHWAASAGEAAMVETLLSYGADPNARASDGRTSLHVAAGLGRTSVPIVSRLIGAGADVNLLDKGGRSPLHIAAGQLDAGSISALINAGAKVNVTDATQRTPLVIAVTVGSSVGANAAAIDTLILNGADVNLADQSGRTPLHYVCAAGRIDLAEVLLQVGGIDVNKKDNSGMTPMSLAVGSKSGGDRLVRLLVNHGASPTFAKSR